MGKDDVAVRFNKVSFEYGREKPILDEASFALRRGTKITLMGQNGAGKSTILELITGTLKENDGSIYVDPSLNIAYAKQVIPRDQLELTLRDFFAKYFQGASFAKAPAGRERYDLDRKIDEVLEVVNLKAPKDKAIKLFSGGQQARLLLASALIQNPDLLI
ncbi:MAG TPA: hypothetical protein DIT25_03375, partial [Candidatus Moranbacteria bacterium]|nr:hypothetical protein [Candidatus Moranbacteria bacterium]